MTDDLVKRLEDIFKGDHDRGCQGRECECSCGFDARTFATAEEAAARIKADGEEIARLRDLYKREAGAFDFQRERNVGLAVRLYELETEISIYRAKAISGGE